MFTISIHALVKRATRKAALPYLDTIISIHALVKRATKYEEVGYYFFNISIHALIKRATYASHIAENVIITFQSTPS